jgi:hypothetical protein
MIKKIVTKHIRMWEFAEVFAFNIWHTKYCFVLSSTHQILSQLYDIYALNFYILDFIREMQLIYRADIYIYLQWGIDEIEGLLRATIVDSNNQWYHKS